MRYLKLLIILFIANIGFAQAQGIKPPSGITLGGSGINVPTSVSLGGEGFDTPSAQYDTDAQALFTRCVVQPSDAQKTAINNIIVNLKAGGYWTGWEWFNVSALMGSGQAGLLNWVQVTNATNVNSTPFSAGWTGNGTTSYLNLNWNPTDDGLGHFTQNDNCAFVIVATDVGNNNMVDIGGRTATGTKYFYLLSRNGSSKTLGSNNDGTTSTASGTTTSSIGYFWNVRTSSTAGLFYQNASSLGAISVTSTGIPSDDFYVCAYNVAGTPLLFSTRKIRGWGIGKSRSGANITAIEGIIETELDALGVGVK